MVVFKKENRRQIEFEDEQEHDWWDRLSLDVATDGEGERMNDLWI